MYMLTLCFNGDFKIFSIFKYEQMWVQIFKISPVNSSPELPEEEERIKAVYQKLEELPPANFSTLERLIFHLVR